MYSQYLTHFTIFGVLGEEGGSRLGRFVFFLNSETLFRIIVSLRLEGITCPTPVLKAGGTPRAAQDLVQWGSEHPQG